MVGIGAHDLPLCNLTMADPATDQLRLHLVLELHESERSPFSEQSFSVPESVLDDSDHPGRPEQAFLTVHSTPSNWRTQKCAYYGLRVRLRPS